MNCPVCSTECDEVNLKGVNMIYGNKDHYVWECTECGWHSDMDAGEEAQLMMRWN